jgi:hypothetical protein
MPAVFGFRKEWVCIKNEYDGSVWFGRMREQSLKIGNSPAVNKKNSIV